MSTEILGSDVRNLTAFSVNIHKRKKGILPVECMGLAQEKGAPVLPGAPPIGNVYSNLRNQIHLPPQNVSSCRKRIKKFSTAFLRYFRGLLSEFDLAQISVQRILPGRQFFESVLGQFLFAHAAVGRTFCFCRVLVRAYR